MAQVVVASSDGVALVTFLAGSSVVGSSNGGVIVSGIALVVVTSSNGVTVVTIGGACNTTRASLSSLQIFFEISETLYPQILCYKKVTKLIIELWKLVVFQIFSKIISTI